MSQLNIILSKQFSDIIKSSLTDRYFEVRQDDAYFDLKEIKDGVPQGTLLGLVLYLLNTCEFDKNIVATSTKNTAILIALQNGINKFDFWAKTYIRAQLEVYVKNKVGIKQKEMYCLLRGHTNDYLSAAKKYLFFGITGSNILSRTVIDRLN